MSGSDTASLAVDSALIRQAASVVDRAAAAFTGPTGLHREPCPLTDGSLGPSTPAREVVVRTRDRLDRAQDAKAGMATLSREMSDRLRIAADGFEFAESTLIDGPR